MFKGFNIDANIDTHLSRSNGEDFVSEFDILMADYNTEINNSFQTLIQLDANGTIDANQLQNDWFPKIEADIFLSHSHDDLELAKKLAGYLYKKFGLKTFIDSTLWGSSNTLLKDIDDRYSKRDDFKYYDYSKRNFSTSCIHMILSSALYHMIDNCEAFFFLNTPNSIKDISFKNKNLHTASPWIFYELDISKKIRIVKPRRHAHQIERIVLSESRLPIKFPANTEHLTKLNNLDFTCWEILNNRNQSYYNTHSLDTLYKIKKTQ